MHYSGCHATSRIYLRQSKDVDDDRLAVGRQREDCTALCAQRGWTVVEYCDNDTTASRKRGKKLNLGLSSNGCWPIWRRAGSRRLSSAMLTGWCANPLRLNGLLRLPTSAVSRWPRSMVSTTWPQTTGGCFSASRSPSRRLRWSASLRGSVAPICSAAQPGTGRRRASGRSATPSTASRTSPRHRS